jgi:circadian clock protein KaiC
MMLCFDFVNGRFIASRVLRQNAAFPTEMTEEQTKRPLVSMGIEGLDQILCGGLPAYRQYLVEGVPGTGKTTLALQFLLEGRRRGETCLYITLSETRAELLDVASSHGFNLDGIELYELEAAEARLKPEDEYTVFRPEEVELNETMEEIFSLVKRVEPSRVVFDSLSELRLLAREPLRYRRQILGLKQFFAGRNCTVLLLDDKSVTDADLQLQSISHGVLSLERSGQEYGASRRRLNVVKLRGAEFRDGYHDYVIRKGGLRVYPRLVASEHRKQHRSGAFSSGVQELDELLGGGLYAGTSTLLMGPAGTGKSTIAGAFLASAQSQGLSAVAYIFEETRQTYIERMKAIGLDLDSGASDGRTVIEQIDPAELSPGEFIDRIRNEVENRDARVVVIDSLNGYLNAMPNERFLMVQLHELLSYLAEMSVVSLIVAAQHGLVGQMQAPVDVSYLADMVILTRFFEVNSTVEKAISVVKNRKAKHEKTIRGFTIESGGLRIGKALSGLHGVLTGTPFWTGREQAVLEKSE